MMNLADRIIKSLGGYTALEYRLMKEAKDKMRDLARLRSPPPQAIPDPISEFRIQIDGSDGIWARIQDENL